MGLIPDATVAREFGPAHSIRGLLQSSPLGLDVPVEYQTNLNTTRISSLGHVPYVYIGLCFKIKLLLYIIYVIKPGL